MITHTSYPSRIVCLAAEAPEILDRLGAFERIVAVSGFARQPAAVRQLPKVGGFADPQLDKILALQPDLAITITDIQAEIAAQLIKAGIPVLALNPHRLADVWRNIRLIGGVLGFNHAAEQLVAELQADLEPLRSTAPLEARPRVYFEEWHEPLISGIGWVSDLIDWVGGVDIFRELAEQPRAPKRVVDSATVLERQPEVIIASWCGKKADLAAIRNRPGWAQIPAVARGTVYEIASDDLLQTGPNLLKGAKALQQLIQQDRGAVQ
ncbi:MAG: ABC transporter substrate-binding protein [Caldilineaceae bacterium]|nr:ABC transporter substrate-binding protein [Caldilineaceae bacterium]